MGARLPILGQKVPPLGELYLEVSSVGRAFSSETRDLSQPEVGEMLGFWKLWRVGRKLLNQNEITFGIEWGDCRIYRVVADARVAEGLILLVILQGCGQAVPETQKQLVILQGCGQAVPET